MISTDYDDSQVLIKETSDANQDTYINANNIVHDQLRISCKV